MEGVIPVVQTALNADGTVDVEGQEGLVDFLIGCGIGGFWVLGTNSEDMVLSGNQRLAAARAAVDANWARSRVPLILGAGFMSMPDIRTFMELTNDWDFDAYHVMPYHPLLSLDGMEKFYRTIADYSPKPIWMYTSANWCRHFPPEFGARLKDHPNIVGWKYSTNKTTDLMAALELEDDNFQVITAVAKQFHAALCMGYRACTTSVDGCLPEPLVGIYHHYRNGTFAPLNEQRKLNDFLSRLPDRARKVNFLPAAEEKAILEIRGICSRHVAEPYEALTDGEVETVKALMVEYGYI